MHFGWHREDRLGQPLEFPASGPRGNGSGHRIARREECAGDRSVPDLPAGWVPRRALQGPEHVKQLLRHARRRRTGSGSGGAGRGMWGRTAGRNESHPSQARSQPPIAGRSPGQAGGQGNGRLLRQCQADALAKRREVSGHTQVAVRRGGYRGRRQPGRDQLEAKRNSQYASRPALRRTGPAGGRHRPGRRFRVAGGHDGNPGPAREGRSQGIHHQQISWRRFPAGAGTGVAGGKNRQAGTGSCALLSGHRNR